MIFTQILEQSFTQIQRNKHVSYHSPKEKNENEWNPTQLHMLGALSDVWDRERRGCVI